MDKQRRKSSSSSSNKNQKNKFNKPGNKANAKKRPGGFKKSGKPQRSSGRKPSTLDPSLLIKKGNYVEEKQFISEHKYADLPLSGKLKKLLEQKGFERPTEIQERSLEALLQGKDILGIAQTGTGKTGAFLIPVIEQLLHTRQSFTALVVVPTRELATQVEDEFRSLTKGLGFFSSCFIGGTNINSDLNALKRPKHVIIGTPGRLLDLAERKALHFNKFSTLILDEFDRMLDMGFAKDVQRIIKNMYKREQTMLFSATLDKSQQSLIDEILNRPVVVKVSSGQVSNERIDQDIIRLKEGDNKFNILLELLRQKDCKKTVLFEETKHRVNRLCQKLNKAGIKADQIQGNKSQNARQKALNAFKSGNIEVLVATDVAARGIDVSDVTHVINYQVPMTYDSYIHRIGRTGRAGKIGKAFTFVDP